MRAILILVGLAVGQLASAFEAVPVRSFAKRTADNKHLLVMLLPCNPDARDHIDVHYPRSGLYPVGNQKLPVWECVWVAKRDRDVVVANDAIHAARVPDSDPAGRHWALKMNPPAGGIPAKPADIATRPALLLYKNGKLVRTVALGEAFDCSALTDADCFMGPVVSLDGYHDASGTVSLSIDGEGGLQNASVDMATGKVTIKGTPTSRGKCGNDGTPTNSGFLGLGGPNSGLDNGRQGLGLVLLGGVVTVVVLFVVFAVVALRKKGTPAADWDE